MNAYIPDTSQGWLPAFVFVVGITAITNALQSYRDKSYLQRVYNPPASNHNPNPVSKGQNATFNAKDASAADRSHTASDSEVTDLSARIFGTWNIAVGCVRLFAAYTFFDKSWFHMSLLTNLIGLLHFGLEAFVYKTARPSGPWLAPVSVAVIGAVWHILQYDNYVK